MEDCVTGQGEDLLANRSEKRLRVATGKIGSPD